MGGSKVFLFRIKVKVTYGEEEDKFSLCKSNYYLSTSGFILLLLLHNHLQTAAEQPKNTLGNRNRDITQLSAG